MVIFKIRKATMNDMPVMLKIYEDARVFMKANGNESQWGLPAPGKKCWPSVEAVTDKINRNIQYICETEINDKCVAAATFAFTNGEEEPAYKTIYEGQWPDDGSVPYGVIHCFASSGQVKGVATYCINWALDVCRYMKIDTHPANKPMQALLRKLGFTYCGKVIMDCVQNDDVVRIAFCKKI